MPRNEQQNLHTNVIVNNLAPKHRNGPDSKAPEGSPARKPSPSLSHNEYKELPAPPVKADPRLSTTMRTIRELKQVLQALDSSARLKITSDIKSSGDGPAGNASLRNDNALSWPVGPSPAPGISLQSFIAPSNRRRSHQKRHKPHLNHPRKGGRGF